MPDTLQRQWAMLRLIPREPRRISVTDIQQKLAAADFYVTARTIQRDLQELSALFPLTIDDRNKPYGWSWTKDGRIFDLPGMDPQTALTFRLVEKFLQLREDLGISSIMLGEIGHLTSVIERLADV